MTKPFIWIFYQDCKKMFPSGCTSLLMAMMSSTYLNLQYLLLHCFYPRSYLFYIFLRKNPTPIVTLLYLRGWWFVHTSLNITWGCFHTFQFLLSEKLKKNFKDVFYIKWCILTIFTGTFIVLLIAWH